MELEMGYGAALPIPFLRAMRTLGGARGTFHGLNFSVVGSVTLGVMRDGILKISTRYIGVACAY